jgi:signal transduction histidine kinase
MAASPRGVEPAANLSVVKKGLVLAAIPLLTQLVFLSVLFKMRQDQLRAQKLAIHSKEVIAQTEGAFRVVMEARSAVRSLALTGDPSFVSDWEKSRQAALIQLGTLRDFLHDNPPQMARVDAIIQQTEEALRRLDAIAQLARRPQSRGKAVAALGEPWALHFLDNLREKVNSFLKEEEHLDDQRSMELERTRQDQAGTLIGGAVLALLSTAMLAYAFSRSITSRLAVLMANVRRLTSGEQLATPLGGRDELGRLDRVFHEMAETLVQKERENELFVYSVSHDLRSPLVNLEGFSQELSLVCQELRRLVTDREMPAGLRERCAALLDKDVNESIHFIQTAVRRLSTIIDALLRLSRVGRVVYDWQQVDVRATVERVVKALGNTIGQKGARVAVGDLTPAWGDPTAIEQIFANLLGNAFNYLDPSRPGIVEVGDGGFRGESGHEQTAEELRMYYVKDNGLGIDPEHLSKIFLAFQRLHPTAAAGEGIGLPLVRRMVERHGGRIWVESALGQGSTFFVCLPALPSNGAAVNGQFSGARIARLGEQPASASWLGPHSLADTERWSVGD